MMFDPPRLFRVLGDETRLRILSLLARDELSAREIEQVMNLGQSRISAQLAQIRESLPLRERRDGRRVYLQIDRDDAEAARLLDFVEPMIRDRESCRSDRQNLAELRRRQAEAARGEAENEDRLSRNFQPGRTWEGFARALLAVSRFDRVLDIGVGDGELTALLAEASRSLVAVEPDEATRQGCARKLQRRGLEGVELRAGEIEALPAEDEAFDLVVASQVLHHAEDPAAALGECARVLVPGGQLLVLDLQSHAESWVRERFAHRHLGFDAQALRTSLRDAGLESIEVRPAARDPRPPFFVTLLASARKEVS
jgi:SAM-dependent methyltransferase